MSHENETDMAASHRRFIGFSIAFAALGFLLFGYDTGVIAGAILFVKKEMQLTPTMVALVVSILLAGATLGAVVSGFLVERLGHRRILLGAGFLFSFGALLAAFSTSFSMLVVALFLLGLAVGTASTQVILYICEIAPTEVRGKLATLAPFTGTCGILVSYFMSYVFSLHGQWRWMFGVTVVPSLMLMIGLFFAPDSPRWLVRRGRVDEALAVLGRSRPQEQAKLELAEI